MLKAWLGEETFRKGSDLYFERLDGTAATIEQFLDCFAVASGEDMSQFIQWYHQAGTPRLTVRRHETPTTPVISQVVSFTQETPPTPGQKTKHPMLLPIRWQPIGDDGPLMEPQLTVMTTEDTSVSYPRFDVPHSISVLQQFSAPVILNSDASTEDLLRLMGRDPDAFNRWEAGQTLARRLLAEFAKALEAGEMPPQNSALREYTEALGMTLRDPQFDDAFKALVLTPPSAMEVLMDAAPVDPIAVHEAGNWLSRAIADALRDDLLATYKSSRDDGPFSPDAAAAGRRALKGRCLSLLAARFDPLAASLAANQLDGATNMTDEIGALVTLSRLGGQRVESSMAQFFEKWKDQPLVIDKWYSVQSMRHHASGIHAIIRLAETPTYERNNPNRVRALVGGFAMGNVKLFHKIDGSGYRFFADQVLDMDGRNPSVAARLLGAFEIWRKLDPARQALMRAELDRVIAAKPSKNVMEIAQRTRG